ncbi:MAG: PspC domain-containing protein [bacterium]|nr:PspC domain-containing protein [bacterium]MDE0287718.1 PspC domain-containing protein [bacterium]MDE0439962.1 PspC domain-containing protein [bacterium]
MSNGTTSLYRPVEGRWLAGVAAGLGLRFGVPVWIIRVAFALLCFAGGLGALLYVAGWLLIPREGETDAIVQGWLGTGQARRWVGVILVALAVIILATETGLIRGDLAFAVVLIGIGVMLYRGDLSRGDRQQAVAAPSDQASQTASTQAMPPDSESGPQGRTRPTPPAQTPPPARETSILGRVTVGFAVLALGALGLFDSVIPGFHPQFGHYVALLVAVIGLGLVVGAWFGRPGGLIVLGMVLIPFLVLSPLAELVDRRSPFELNFTMSERSIHRPGSVEGILDGYDLGFGSLLLDLRSVDFDGRTVSTEVDLGIGEVIVYLPEGVSARVDGDVGIGELRVGSQGYSGLGVDAVYNLEGSEGRLVLDADVGIGQVLVRARPVPDPPLPPSVPEPPRNDGAAVREYYRIQLGEFLRDDYALDDGSLRLDLSDLFLEDDRRVDVDVDRGEVWVTVPRELGLRVTARVDHGRLTMFNEVREGSDLSAKHTAQISGTHRLTLDIRLGEGTVIVEEGR